MFHRDFSVRYDTASGATARTRRKDGIGRTVLSGNLTRTGVLQYRMPDGSVRRELRHPDEVFSPASLNSLRAAPVTDMHPNQPVTVASLPALGKGVVVDVKADGRFVVGECAIADDSLIAAIERGDRHDVSPGYKCRIDNTPGVYNGEEYDAVQRDIEYNHVAVGPRGWGRSGEQVSLRADGGDVADVGVEIVDPTEEPTVPDAAAPAPPVEVKAPVEEAPALTTTDVVEAKQDAIEARLDAALAELAAARAERDEATAKLAQIDIAALVSARMELERQAAKIAPGLRCDGLSDNELRLAALKSKRPGVSLEGKSDEYIVARFDAELDLATVAGAEPRPRPPAFANKVVREVQAARPDPNAGLSARQKMILGLQGKN